MRLRELAHSQLHQDFFFFYQKPIFLSINCYPTNEWVPLVFHSFIHLFSTKPSAI